MLEVEIDKMISVTEARANIASVINDVMQGKPYLLIRNGKPVVAIVPMAMLGKLAISEASRTRSDQTVTILKEAKPPVSIQKEPELGEIEERKQKTPTVDFVKIGQVFGKVAKNQVSSRKIAE